MSARVEEKAGHLIKARSLLEKARQCNPGTAELWLEAVRVENRAGLSNVASSLMAKGNVSIIIFIFTACPMQSTVLARGIPSVCPSHSLIVSRQLKMRSCGRTIILVSGEQGSYGQGKSGNFEGVSESQGKQRGSGKSQGILKYCSLDQLCMHYFHNFVGFWGLCPQTPTGAPPM